MSDKRYGGHVIRNGRWVPAELAEDDKPETDPLDEYAVGGGWYQIGEEKVQGKKAARALLDG